MPRIPDVSAVGFSTPRTATPRFADRSAEIIGRAELGAAATLGNASDDAYLHEQRERQKTEIETRNLNNAKGSNALLDHDIALKTKATEIGERIASGDLDYNKAQQEFADYASKTQLPEIAGADPVLRENLDKGVKRLNSTAAVAVSNIVTTARKADFRSQFADKLDKLGKLAGMPGSNIDDLNAQAQQFIPLAVASGLPKDQIDKAVQDFKDGNWQNNALQRVMQSKDDIGKLKVLEHDLSASDGFYVGKIDTDRRNSVLRQVINDRLQVENRIAHESDKREIKAERAIGQMYQQISSGVPATAEQWQAWDGVTKGTSVADQFEDMQKDEAQVQQVLRQPVDKQVSFVQAKEARLLKGGSVKDAANLSRLKTAVQANVTQLQTNPLVFNANRNGVDVAPVDFSMLDSSDTAAQLQDRVATLQTMQKQYGAQIPLKPLLPQEASQLAAALNDGTPKDQAEVFAGLRTAFKDPAAYRAAMQQIAPDAPVKALAGMLSAKQAELTTGTHWFKPDDTVASKDVAAIMLQGEQLLHPSKTDKAGDGKPKTGLYLPESATLQNDFQSAVGNAFAGRPQAAEIAFQAVQAYYVGKASQTGRLASGNKDIDTGLVKEAVTATLGGVANYNGAGEVLMPWGMDRSTFDDRATAQLAKLGKGWADAGLRNNGDSTYYVMSGRNFALDKRGKPVTIDVSQAPEPLKLDDVAANDAAAIAATRGGTR